MQFIVLAGGFGRRLNKVIQDVPKPMADIGGKPFLTYLLTFLLRFPISKIVVSVGYKKEFIQNYFKDSFHNIPIVYSCETDPLGTGGAIKQAFEYINDEFAIVINGDTFFKVDLLNFFLFSKNLNSDVVVALKYLQEVQRYGFISLNAEGRISAFKEKSDNITSGLINGGIYFIRKNVFQNTSYIHENKFSFEDFLIQTKDDNAYYGKVFDNYFIDFGIPEDYLRAIKEIPALFHEE